MFFSRIYEKMSNRYIFGNVGEAKSQIGTNTMVDTSGEGNSAYGNNIFTSLTTGVHNSGFGSEIATSLSANPSYCSALGYKVLTNVTSGTNNSAFGYQSLQALTTGSNNSVLGSNAGNTLTTGSGNTICGDSADVVEADTSNSTVLGAGAVGADKSIVVGRNAACLTTGSNVDCIVSGQNIQLQSGSVNSIALSGYTNSATPTIVNSMTLTPFLDGTGTIANSVIISDSSNPLTLNITDSVNIGRRTIEKNGSRNVVLADNGSTSLTGGSDNVIIGVNAGAPQTDGNVLVGFSVEGTTLGLRQTAMGSSSMSTMQNTSIEGDLTFVLDSHADFVATYSVGFYAGFLLLKITNQSIGNVTNSSGGTAVVPLGLLGIVTVVEGSVTESETTIIDFTDLTQAAVLGTYFLISSTTTDYYVWFTDGFSTDPLVPGRTGVPISIPSSFGAASTAWSNTIIALSALEGSGAFFVISGIIKIENAVVGNVTDAAPGTAFGTNKLRGMGVIRQGSVTTTEITVIDYGQPIISALNGDYFLLSSPTTDYYVWFTDGTATDPMIVGRTGIEVLQIPVQNNTGMGVESLSGNSYLVTYTSQFKNTTGFGGLACRNSVLGGCNTMFGYNIADMLQIGSNNTGMGASAMFESNTANSVAVGKGCGVIAATYATVIGSRSFTFGGVTNVSIVGENCISGFIDNQFQIGSGSLSSPTEVLRFRTQTVAEEAWVGTGETSVFINNSGNIIRNNDTVTTVSTTNSTVTTLNTFPLSDNTSVQLETRLLGRVTGGGSGVVDNIYAIRIDSAAKRTGAVTLTRTIETHVDEDPLSILVTNLTAGSTYDIAEGTAVSGTNELYSVFTLIQGRNANSNNLSYFDLNNYIGSFVAGAYFLTSSPTVDYYVWYDTGSSTDPMVPARTGVQVIVNTFDPAVTLASKTAIALNAVGAIFTASTPSTLLRISVLHTVVRPDISPGTASTGGTGEIEGIYTFFQGVPVLTFEKALLDFTGATPTGLEGKWFYIFNDTTTYFVWYRVDLLTPFPTNSRLVGLTAVLVDILSTDTASMITSKTSSAITAQTTGFLTSTTTTSTDIVKWSNVAAGACTATSAGTFPAEIIANVNDFTTGVVEVSTVNATDATPAGLDGKYFFLASSTTDYYFWYNVDGATVDPSPPGPHTSAVIAILSADTATMIKTKTIAAISAIGGGTVFIATTQATWSADMVVSGTNLELRVTGIEGVNINWKSQTRKTTV